MIYLDASALVKLAVTEPESGTLREWLAAHADTPRISSDLVRVEVTRAVMRSQPHALLQAHQVVSRVNTILVGPELLATAASLQLPTLRSLDAVHLASALLLRNRLTSFVGYDDRLTAAVRAAGLPAASPGGTGRAGVATRPGPASRRRRPGSAPRSPARSRWPGR